MSDSILHRLQNRRKAIKANRNRAPLIKAMQKKENRKTLMKEFRDNSIIILLGAAAAYVLLFKFDPLKKYGPNIDHLKQGASRPSVEQPAHTVKPTQLSR